MAKLDVFAPRPQDLLTNSKAKNDPISARLDLARAASSSQWSKFQNVSGQIAYLMFHQKPSQLDMDIYRFENNGARWAEVFFPGTQRENEIREQLPASILQVNCCHANYVVNGEYAVPDLVTVQEKNVQATYKRKAESKDPNTTEGFFTDLRGYAADPPSGGANAKQQQQQPQQAQRSSQATSASAFGNDDDAEAQATFRPFDANPPPQSS